MYLGDELKNYIDWMKLSRSFTLLRGNNNNCRFMVIIKQNFEKNFKVCCICKYFIGLFTPNNETSIPSFLNLLSQKNNVLLLAKVNFP